MSHTVLVVNGRTIIDADFQEWQARHPQEFQNLINPNATETPWMKPAMLAIADALLRMKPIQVDVETREHGYHFTVSLP